MTIIQGFGSSPVTLRLNLREGSAKTPCKLGFQCGIYILEFEMAIESMDEDDMTMAELDYYLEVTSRVSRKLMSVVE